MSDKPISQMRYRAVPVILLVREDYPVEDIPDAIHQTLGPETEDEACFLLDYVMVPPEMATIVSATHVEELDSLSGLLSRIIQALQHKE